MDKFDKAAARAEEAERVLESVLFTAAFEDTRTALLEAWAKLDRADTEHAKDLHRMVQCLDKVKRCLEEHVNTGKIARKEIEGRSKRPFSFGR